MDIEIENKSFNEEIKKKILKAKEEGFSLLSQNLVDYYKLLYLLHILVILMIKIKL